MFWSLAIVLRLHALDVNGQKGKYISLIFFSFPQANKFKYNVRKARTS